MQIVLVDGDDKAHELDVGVNSPSATVGDLLDALGGSDSDALQIGDHLADPDFELGEAGLHEGAVVRVVPARWHQPRPAPTTSGPKDRELAVVNGLDAGRRFRLAPGVTVVGRAPGCDAVLANPTVSQRHASLSVAAGGEVTVEDLGSHNGTWIGDRAVTEPVVLDAGTTLRLGALELAVRPVDVGDRPIAVDPLRHTSAAGTIAFNRPPRPAPPPPATEAKLPTPPKTGQSKVPLSLIAILAPLVFAGLMFAVVQQPRFLLFAGLSPVMAIANAVDSKRKGRRSDRGERERFARELDDLRDQLDELARHERRRRAGAWPDPTEALRRVTVPSTTLWERRPTHHDFLVLRGGVGDVRRPPPVAGAGRSDLPDELVAALDEAASLPAAPVPVDLSEGGVVGIVGDRAAALAVARSLVCQAAALHGPADMPVMALVRPEAASAWDWVKWLPHTRDATGAGRMLAADPEQSARLVESRLKAAAGDRDRPPAGATRTAGPTLLAVVDDESLTEGRKAPTRSLLRGDGGLVAGIVVAATPDRLPAVCTTVIEMDGPDGRADLHMPQRGEHVPGLLAAGTADDVARDCARTMARFEDPELDIAGAGLPASIRLLPLLEMDEATPDGVLARWRAGGVDPRPSTPIGIAEHGVFSVDFVADGPHALVGGTTGAGKSELLRSMVAGLAATVDPDHLTFVLIDFKGGSAFDECAKLPHTVGMVSDLDEHLAERALRCLEAELKHRERVLRDAGAIDLPDYLRGTDGSEPMPRLLVIIDEFATLKAELPDFIDALVGVAQRGRSLGVHMLLATQRPQGAISDNIRANTNLRIALRVQEKNDSQDVIDVTDAATIPRTAPGRAYIRLGPGEVVAIQSALSTGARDSAALAPVDVAPFVYGAAPRPPAPRRVEAPDTDGGAATDLSLLVDAIARAFARTGRPRPRRPWPDPLPDEVDLDTLLDRAPTGTGEPSDLVPLALADDPEAQTQYRTGWTRAAGNMIAYGIGGAGTTTTLTSLALALTRRHPPDEVHLYALDFGAGELADLAPLPHMGAVILANERERQTRLIRHLRAELDRRRRIGAAARRAEPAIVTLIDGWSAFAAEYNDFAGNSTWDSFTRVFADGPEVDLHIAVSADRATAVPNALAALVRQRLAMRLANPSDYTGFGIRSTAVPEMVPGRALLAGTGQVVQVARPADGVASAAGRVAAAAPPARRPPTPMLTLATSVQIADLDAEARLDVRPWTVPVGLAETTLGPAELVIHQGEHAMITGPARCGKSTALLAMTAVCRAARPDLTVVAVAGRRSPLVGDERVDRVVVPEALGDELRPLVDAVDGPVLVLVDDAEAVDDSGNVLGRLSTSDRPDLLFVAAGRNDGIRTGYSHWTRPLRRSRLGVLIRPNIELDADMLGTSLPRRAPVTMVPGRGYLVNSGDAELVQVALP